MIWETEWKWPSNHHLFCRLRSEHAFFFFGGGGLECVFFQPKDDQTIYEGSLNSKLPTIWTVEKQSRVVKSAETRCNSAKVRRKKIHPRQMLEKSRNAVFFQ